MSVMGFFIHRSAALTFGLEPKVGDYTLTVFLRAPVFRPTGPFVWLLLIESNDRGNKG
jgi:hypothetical protein